MRVSHKENMFCGGKKDSELPAVSVIVPMKDEKEYIGPCLESIVSQDYPRELIEIIVVDGGSSDSSLKIVETLAEEHSNIQLLGGPGVNCPVAMNRGIEAATGELISKIDAHGYVASNFLRMSTKHLRNEENIKCVGGPVIPVPQTSIAKANALARSSLFGVGKGVYSSGVKPQFVQTVQCGVYEKDVFKKVGLFDESLQFGEDEEINWRITKEGYKIFSTPEVKFFYFPRKSFRGLLKQYYNYGIARVKVIRKHPHFFEIKHVIPATFVVALLGSGTLSMFSNLWSKLFFGIVVVYFTVSLAFSISIGKKEGNKYVGLLPISFAALHLGYGMGFLRGIVGCCFFSRVRHWRKG